MAKQPATTKPQTARSLSAALTAIENRHQVYHWHCWKSDAGRLWAGSPHCEQWDGAGTTVDGGSPECLERAIAEAEHNWHTTRRAA